MFAKNLTSSRAIERMFFYQKASGNSPNAVRMAFKGLSVKPVAHAFPVGVASKPLVGVETLLPYTPLVGPIFGFVPMPLLMLLPLLAITALYIAANEVVKQWFYHRVQF